MTDSAVTGEAVKDGAIVDRLLDVLGRAADRYGQEAVNQCQHALQCAALAERAGATPELVAASLLHDVGHLLHALGEDAALRGVDARHEDVGAAFLARHFTPAVVDPVRLHVDAKRYLCGAKADYFDRLSPASVRSLELQGGPFDAAGQLAYLARPHARDALRLRVWDDEAKDPAAITPPLAHYRAALEAGLRRA
jgi:phosphonate degradation associated HDIG domain protein